MSAKDGRYAIPPVNVRVEHRDGSHTPVETMYAGLKNGIHHWHTVREIVLRDGDRKAWDEMPEDTEVHLYPLRSRYAE
jgi:hypothetical protein